MRTSQLVWLVVLTAAMSFTFAYLMFAYAYG